VGKKLAMLGSWIGDEPAMASQLSPSRGTAALLAERFIRRGAAGSGTVNPLEMK